MEADAHVVLKAVGGLGEGGGLHLPARCGGMILGHLCSPSALVISFWGGPGRCRPHCRSPKDTKARRR